MRAAVVLLSVMTAGCSLLFAVDDVRQPEEADEPPEEATATVDASAPVADEPCPPPIIRKRRGIVCD